MKWVYSTMKPITPWLLFSENKGPILILVIHGYLLPPIFFIENLLVLDNPGWKFVFRSGHHYNIIGDYFCRCFCPDSRQGAACQQLSWRWKSIKLLWAACFFRNSFTALISFSYLSLQDWNYALIRLIVLLRIILKNKYTNVFNQKKFFRLHNWHNYKIIVYYQAHRSDLHKVYLIILGIMRVLRWTLTSKRRYWGVFCLDLVSIFRH